MSEVWKNCGHPRTPENTRCRPPFNIDHCRLCNRLRDQKRRQQGKSNGYENNPAHREVAEAVKEGRLVNLREKEVMCADYAIRPGCLVRATMYDHRDYSRPLDVEPVCRSCNGLRGAARPVEALDAAHA